MNNQSILDQVETDFGGRIPGDALDIIDAMLAAKNLGNKTMDVIQGQFASCSDGFYLAAKSAIVGQRAAENWTPKSTEAARADRILRTRNSDGKAQSRQW